MANLWGLEVWLFYYYYYCYITLRYFIVANSKLCNYTIIQIKVF